jgi:hypothetical protein
MRKWVIGIEVELPDGVEPPQPHESVSVEGVGAGEVAWLSLVEIRPHGAITSKTVEERVAVGIPERVASKTMAEIARATGRRASDWTCDLMRLRRARA